MLNQNPFWEIKDDVFIPLNFEENDFSEEAKDIIKKIRNLQVSETIYIRGSIVEKRLPFAKSDVDLFVIYSNRRSFQVRNQLEKIIDRDLDIKWMNLNDLESDIVYYSLLSLRSHHICGDKLDFRLMYNNREFAWKNWIKYFPSGVPDELYCSDRFSVINFKQLVRSFGVIMLLKDDKFSRDIDVCIDYSSYICNSIKVELSELKYNIEKSNNKIYNTYRIKNLLKELFDNYF